jgi:DnaK suppressor protein
MPWLQRYGLLRLLAQPHRSWASHGKERRGMVRTATLAEIRRRLEAEHTQLQSDIDALASENQNQHDDTGIGNHLADDASEVFTRERNMALRTNAEELLVQVDAALTRLDEGTYGICARCGREITSERLEALPYATLCITCQSEVERSR